MDFATLLLNLLAGANALATTKPQGPGAGAERAALDALTARLEDAHDLETLSLLPRALAESGVRQSILVELLDPAIARDPAVTTQAELLRAELESLPADGLAEIGLSPAILSNGRATIALAVEDAAGRPDADGPERDLAAE